MALPILPAFLQVFVLGQPINAMGKPNKAGTTVWYEESGIVPELVEDPDPILAAITAVYDGAALSAGEVHTSAPRKYAKGHDKAGQAIPGTGGNRTVTHSASIKLRDERGADHGYTLMVTVTYLEDKGFRITVKAVTQKTSKVLEGITLAMAPALASA